MLIKELIRDGIISLAFNNQSCSPFLPYQIVDSQSNSIICGQINKNFIHGVGRKVLIKEDYLKNIRS